jgi:ribosomal protein S18 acetylase RimI-like enzyme
MKSSINFTTFERVRSYEEAYAVALIRNECREFMTNDTSELDVERQIKFFEKHRHSQTTVLFIQRRNEVPTGYALMQFKGRKVCITGGLARPYRGKGLGLTLFRCMLTALRHSKHKVWLTVLRSNLPAVRLYKHLGFKITLATRTVYTMELPR